MRDRDKKAHLIQMSTSSSISFRVIINNASSRQRVSNCNVTIVYGILISVISVCFFRSLSLSLSYAIAKNFILFFSYFQKKPLFNMMLIYFTQSSWGWHISYVSLISDWKTDWTYLDEWRLSFVHLIKLYFEWRQTDNQSVSLQV